MPLINYVSRVQFEAGAIALLSFALLAVYRIRTAVV